LITNVDERYKSDYFFERELFLGKRKVEKNKFYKVDIDLNGKTDILINGKSLFAVLDKGENIYQVFYFSGGFSTGNKAHLISFGKVTNNFQIVLSQSKNENRFFDTVIYRFGTFIEPARVSIDSFNLNQLRYYSYGCRLSCPRYNLIVERDGNAKLYATEYVPKKGVFAGKIPLEEVSRVSDLLKYINPDSLKKEYRVPWYHDVGCGLEIKYNGIKKSLIDDGSNGTFGLEAVYSYLKRWYLHTKWEEVK
jgi:hypothetical protein